MSGIDAIVFHYTGVESDVSPWQTARYQTQAAPAGYPEIAYHVYIEQDGTIYFCLPYNKLSWHCGSGSTMAYEDDHGWVVGYNNWHTIGVCWSGLSGPTEAQVASMAWVKAHIEDYLQVPLKALAHREISVDARGRPLTQCCGPSWEDWKGRLGA